MTSDPPRPRWMLLAALLALGAAALAFVRLNPEFELKGLTTGLTLITLVLLAGAVGLWFAFVSRLPGRVRLGGSLAAVALIAGLALCVRVEGYYGDILPILGWRWTPPRDYALPDLKPAAAPAAEAAPAPEGAKIAATDWPRFLGPRGDGWADVSDLPPDWAKQPPREAWRVACGAGWSGCAVAGGLVYTQEQRGEKELVVCRDLKNGDVRWVHEAAARFSEEMGGDGPRATPTVSGGFVYALGATGLLHALDAQTGTTRWTRDTLGESGQPNLQWGKSGSPLVIHDLVVVTLGGKPETTTAAFHALTGEPAWRAGNDKSSYSTPALGTMGGREQLVVVYADSVAAHDPAGGAELWRFAWPGAPAKVASPQFVDAERVLITVGYGLGAKMLKVTPPAAEGQPWSVAQVWHSLDMKTKFTNALVKGAHAYGLDEGRLACIALADGKRTWKDENFGHGQVIGAGDALIVQSERGEVVLVAADPGAYRVLQRIPALTSKTWNYPALAGKHLLVRNDRELVCYRWGE